MVYSGKTLNCLMTTSILFQFYCTAKREHIQRPNHLDHTQIIVIKLQTSSALFLIFYMLKTLLLAILFVPLNSTLIVIMWFSTWVLLLYFTKETKKSLGQLLEYFQVRTIWPVHMKAFSQVDWVHHSYSMDLKSMAASWQVLDFSLVLIHESIGSKAASNYRICKIFGH